MGVIVAAAESERVARQSGVPEGLVLTQRHYPKGNNGKYIPDNSGKYFPRNVKYIHIAGQKSATAVNVGSGGQYSDTAGKYTPDNTGRYSAAGSGKYIPRSEGQYVRSSSEGKYPIQSPRKIDDSRHSALQIAQVPAPASAPPAASPNSPD